MKFIRSLPFDRTVRTACSLFLLSTHLRCRFYSVELTDIFLSQKALSQKTGPHSSFPCVWAEPIAISASSAFLRTWIL